MPKVAVPRDRIAEGTLPPVCVVCGAEAPHRLYPRVAAPSVAWVWFSPLGGLLGFWVYALLGRRVSSHRPAGLPFCDRHRGYWSRRAWFIVPGFIVFVGLITAAAIMTSGAASGKEEEPEWLFGVLGCWMGIYLLAFIIVHLAAMRPTGGNRESLVLSGASREFASALQRGSRPAGR